MAAGNLFILDTCKTLISEIEGYVWDPRASEKGEDKPLKKADHCTDGLRYAIFSHKIAKYNPYAHNPVEFARNKYQITRNFR
jgi:hypothetical protein